MAIRKPVESEGAKIDDQALNLIVQKTRRYPFFLQEWGSFAWDTADTRTISFEDAKTSYELAIRSLDHGFFKARIDRMTRGEILVVNAMAKLGDGPYPVSAIAEEMGKSQKSMSMARDRIIKKGMIYSTDHGYLDFSVPSFSEYLRRQSNK